MPVARTIAIDGPAASGKSTLGKNLAAALDYLYFDTGVLYRAITWVALTREVDLNDEGAITALAERIDIDVRPPSQRDGRAYDVLADDRDVTWEIRLPQVDANVSLVSSYRGVRRAMTPQQRRIASRGSVVMVGRDIGTVVLPEAELKIYLDASMEERAHRRFDELRQRGEPADFLEILAAMRKRDRYDASRKHAPLRQAEDAVRLLTDGMDSEQVLQRALELTWGRDC